MYDKSLFVPKKDFMILLSTAEIKATIVILSISFSELSFQYEEFILNISSVELNKHNLCCEC